MFLDLYMYYTKFSIIIKSKFSFWFHPKWGDHQNTIETKEN